MGIAIQTSPQWNEKGREREQERKVRFNEKNRPFIDKSTMQMSIFWWLKFVVWFGFGPFSSNCWLILSLQPANDAPSVAPRFRECDQCSQYRSLFPIFLLVSQTDSAVVKNPMVVLKAASEILSSVNR